MKSAESGSGPRVVFLDNLRYLFVLCVVVQHSANAYYGHLPLLKWWAVSDADSCTALGMLQITLNIFTMPLLFFLAGYFALPTIRKHRPFPFIAGKMKRLGIPWLVCILTICPLFPLIYHYTRNGMALRGNYFDLWVTLFKKFLQFNIGVIPSMRQLMENNDFYQRYMWFISLLLLFFVVFGLIYQVKKKWFEADVHVTRRKPSVWSSLKMLLAVGSLCLISSIAVSGAVLLSGFKDPASWFTVANLFQFQAISLPTFIIYFSMGVIAYRNHWIEQGKYPGHLNTWIVSTGALLILYLPILYAFLTAPAGSGAVRLYGFLFTVIGSFLTISLLGAFSSVAIRYWNSPTRLNRNLAANSYDIYLAHYIFVLAFQLLLFTFPGIPALIKFTMVCTASLVCAYLASNFMIRPFPRATAVLVFVMLGIMFAMVRVS